MSITLLISSGRGPIECAAAVGLMAAFIAEQATAKGHEALVVERIAAGGENCFHSITLSFEQSAREFCQSFAGSVLWICPSRFRPGHKRKNWFISVSCLEFPEVESLIRPSDIKMTTYRAGVGNGGQNVNKTDSSVRIVHLPTGITVESNEERSQQRNKKIGLLRLAKILREREEERTAANQKTKWDQHNQLVRGNPVMTFAGEDFRRAT